MAYIDPRNVDSPRASWKLIEVLRNGRIDGQGDGDMALALGEWNGDRCFGLRWNGSDADASGVGNPQSRGLPTWFILPEWMHETILGSDIIPEAKRALAAALIRG